MYRESPYSTENEVYIFGQYQNTIDFDGNSMFNEISQSINQMSLQSPQKLSVQKKKFTNDPKSFINLFNRQEQNSEMKQELQQSYCGVCSRMCYIIPQNIINQRLINNTIGQELIGIPCTSCQKSICKKCIEICDKCSQNVCKFCSQIRYESRGDYVFCEQCLI